MSYEPGKIIYQLVVIERDDEGQIVGEHVQPAVVLYPPQFGELATRVEATVNSEPASEPSLNGQP